MTRQSFNEAAELSRRQLLRIGAVGAIGAAGALALGGCGALPVRPAAGTPQKTGGIFMHGATGGGLKDTLDPHFPVTNPDIARVNNLYEPLLFWNDKYELEHALAESLEVSKDALSWTVRLRKDVVFHHGKSLTPDDVMFTLSRLIDPKNTAPGGVELAKVLDLENSKIVDSQTIRLQLKTPYAILDQLLAEYTTGIIPTDFDIAKPVGTGAFKYQSFLPGQSSHFNNFRDYWGKPAYVDELYIYDFADDAAKVNALLAGQVQSVDNLPTYLVDAIKRQGASPLISDTGGWVPFTMRVDAAPYKDNRVRQAMRLIVDRQQMIDQALNGYGVLGNDMYSPFDEAYASDLPQREQDIDKAKSLLKQAGQEGLEVELVTSSAVGSGGVESANVFVEQARKAGVKVRLNKADPNTFYGDQYLSWPFAQDFYNTRQYIPQVAACALKESPYNETHFDNPKFAKLVADASREVDKDKRKELLHAAQKIEYDEGGFIIWGFKRQVDAFSNTVQGFVPHRYLACSSFKFQRVSLTT
ncbi:MAG: ABC transporter substrate-binding protein [Actinomycetota bacterium]|nr:ABC transporter substrate-binding protein [Actinomycetota bacterium]